MECLTRHGIWTDIVQKCVILLFFKELYVLVNFLNRVLSVLSQWLLKGIAELGATGPKSLLGNVW